MRVATTQNGLTLRVIAGTTNIILGIDLAENQRQGCLGFSIQRVDLGPAAAPFAAAQQTSRWLPNLLRFPSDTDASPITTERAPLQKFRWGDYTTDSRPSLSLPRGAALRGARASSRRISRATPA